MPKLVALGCVVDLKAIRKVTGKARFCSARRHMGLCFQGLGIDRGYIKQGAQLISIFWSPKNSIGVKNGAIGQHVGFLIETTDGTIPIVTVGRWWRRIKSPTKKNTDPNTKPPV